MVVQKSAFWIVVRQFEGTWIGHARLGFTTSGEAFSAGEFSGLSISLELSS
jgi:hypothetical protein